MDDWISIEDQLPEKDVWVQVLIDDTVDPQLIFLKQLFKLELKYVVEPAKIMNIIDNYPMWYRASPYDSGNFLNVTHWKPMSESPERVLCDTQD